MIAMLTAVLVASLLGSLHCAGMCGAFCGVAVGGGRSRRDALQLQLAYHGGRLLTYCLLGAAAGAVGALLDLASTLGGLQPIALALAGGGMILIGLAELVRLGGWRTPLPKFVIPAVWRRLLQRGQQYAATKSGVPRALTIGLLTTLLPCGWLYAFLITAAGAGGPLQGIAVMAVFWVGTLPVLMSLGLGVRKLAGVLGPRLPVATATALVLVGVTTLASRSQLSAESLAATVTTKAAQQGQATPNPTELPPCCQASEAAP